MRHYFYSFHVQRRAKTCKQLLLFWALRKNNFCLLRKNVSNWWLAPNETLFRWQPAPPLNYCRQGLLFKDFPCSNRDAAHTSSFNLLPVVAAEFPMLKLQTSPETRLSRLPLSLCASLVTRALPRTERSLEPSAPHPALPGPGSVGRLQLSAQQLVEDRGVASAQIRRAAARAHERPSCAR